MSRWNNAWQLMRIPFSVYLMPVYWFALSNIHNADWPKSIMIFMILHLLVYPASNGYNSYYDKDKESIGGLKNPPAVSRHLYYLVIIFDLLSLVLAYIFISPVFALMTAIYLLVSKAYSNDKIRLKKYPVFGALVVTIFQGAFIFLAITLELRSILVPLDVAYALVSTLFLAGSYPLTQVYQHEEDQRRGDNTLSLMLGIKGTFLFAQIFIALGSALLLVLYFFEKRYIPLIIFPAATLPVLIYFNQWKKKVWKNPLEANYENTMLMNKISSLSISVAFLLILLFEFKLFSLPW